LATVGDRIKDIRTKKGMTQDQLCEKAHISKGFLSDIENNKTNVGSQKLLEIANALRASVDYLLKGESTEYSISQEVTIPPDLSKAAEDLKLSYSETLELLSAHTSIIARRSNKTKKVLTVEEWKKLHDTIKGVFG
jgi:transcriptional regulator with XRE-family HTH domain